MSQSSQQLLQKLPSVDTLLQNVELKNYAKEIPRKIVINSIRQSIQQIRELIVVGKAAELTEDAICQKVIIDAKQRMDAAMRVYYCRVINATGIILHTGLGRAVLPPQALHQIQQQLQGYSLLQLDIETGKRSKRDGCIEWLLQQLTGAEAATVVNNNAAATSIVLNTIAKDKEVIVSRGQLVEIGGSFRLPDVMAFSGAKLVEVGTTNKTHPHDYINAITENTAAILRVHPSNYKIEGFSSEVALEDLVKIAHSNNLVMIDDVGAGALVDFSHLGFEPQPTLTESISKGADIVTSSTDKLIGAPQGGIILGRAKLIEAIRKNQFTRIIRVGKLTLTALEATLKLFLDESIALQEVPTLQMLTRDPVDIARQAKRISSTLHKTLPIAVVKTIPGFSQTGSGSMPAQNLVTTLVAVSPKEISAVSLAKQLRYYHPAIFTRIQNDQVLIDPRTLRDDSGAPQAKQYKRESDEKILIGALLKILGRED
ncbi:MAG: L-seryl-tRNA(Sec) selenium transferase [Planctomycetota bacterium]|jgi:L-seryl-tRNA(Ser) seleniumtransferase